jgi:hypothetical protein
MGTIWACFSCVGTLPSDKERFIKYVKIGAMTSDVRLRNCAVTPSGPGELEDFR